MALSRIERLVENRVGDVTQYTSLLGGNLSFLRTEDDAWYCSATSVDSRNKSQPTLLYVWLSTTELVVNPTTDDNGDDLEEDPSTHGSGKQKPTPCSL